MKTRLEDALQHCPPQLAAALRPYIMADTFKASFSAEEVSVLKHASGLSTTDLSLALLPLAASYAITPLSHFNVGAIAQGISGRWYLGANMEFASAPIQQTVHAEQSAINHAWMCNEPRLTAITVNYTPCGHCRQFMNELNSAQQLTIYLPDCAPQRLHDYLPNAFGPKDLGIIDTLFDPQVHAFAVQSDPLVEAAAQAASLSYAPYTHAYSGIALQIANDHWVTGRYAENAAFNPSLPPLQSALIMLQLQGYSVNDITRAVLVEVNNAVLSQQSASTAILTALGGYSLETLRIDLK
ncbi:cytidine deaminase [Tatumella ptyseos]|uniref:cytidine deaminase n=1 Tax=Tatumella ptyseos TaxID=82987 RepID=UPI0026EF957C|nr:cytidine deaminase [Tatumella ptyseos]WKX25480.1 cytidine deaminase [Tatumella ptyseos]